MYLTPPKLAVAVFGGVRALARAINRDPAAVSRWARGEHIPGHLLRLVHEKAKERGLELTCDELVYGAEVEQEVAT